MHSLKDPLQVHTSLSPSDGNMIALPFSVDDIMSDLITQALSNTTGFYKKIEINTLT